MLIINPMIEKVRWVNLSFEIYYELVRNFGSKFVVLELCPILNSYVHMLVINGAQVFGSKFVVLELCPILNSYVHLLVINGAQVL